MNSRGRTLVKLCVKQKSSTIKNTDKMKKNATLNSRKINISNIEKSAACCATLPAELTTEIIDMKERNSALDIQEINVLNIEKSATFSVNQPNFTDLVAEKEACDYLQKRENVSNFQSAPSSVVNPEPQIDAIIEPRSAPLPINQDASPLSLTIISNDQDSNILAMYGYKENSSPVRGSPISGIELLLTSEEEPFSDSETSWIADTDEHRRSVQKRKFCKIQSGSSDDLSSPKERKQKNKVKKFSKKKVRKMSCVQRQKKLKILQSDSSDSDYLMSPKRRKASKRNSYFTKKLTSPRMTYKKAIIEMPKEDSETESVLSNAGVSAIHRPNHTVDETDSGERSLIVEQQLDSACNKQKNIKRWKKSFSDKWKREVENKKKSDCLPYKDKNGKIHEPKLPRVSKCNTVCRNKCSEQFTQQERLEMCKEYWGIRDFKQQKEYLLRRIIIKPVRRTLKNLPSEKQRATSRKYGFFKNNEFVEVCKSFFMATLSISTGPIETAVKNINGSGSFSGTDKRGKRPPSKKTPEERINEVKTHIESFAVKDSHYCRKNSNRQYLDEHLSISKMYELYKQKMIEIQKEPVKINVYKKVFGTEYNLSFYHPKKDQCGLCNNYMRTQNPKECLKKEYSEHIERKIASFKSKDIDKKKSEEDPTFLCVTMDLQSLLQIPSTADSLMYYSRKLNLYNLSVYEFKPPNNNAHCIIWTEVNGKRGSIEIASAINAWIKTIPETVTHLTLYSDTCSGQNRNQYMSGFLLHLVQTSHLCVVEQKYLESGHSFMEVDSMHSAIEKEKRYTEVYSVIDWKGIMNRARSKRHNKNSSPYNVLELGYKDMIDVKSLAGKIIKNRNTCTQGKKVNWLKIKCLRYEKQFPGIIQFRYDYDGPYMSMDTSCNTGRATRRTTPGDINIAQEVIAMAYEHPLPITDAKKKDLLNLCRKNIIPAELHAWYASLPSTDKITEDLQSGNDSQ